MRPTEILSNEHRVIEVMLSVVENIVDQANTSGKLDKQDAEQVVAFIKTFADTCHHGKEEGQLFPAMEARGIPVEQGPLGVMLHEHDLGRGYVKLMSENIEAASQGNTEALEAFADSAMGYVYLLRNHIQKEDNILFPMAARILNQEAETELLARFDTVEHEHVGTGTHEHYLKIAESLATKYGVSTDPITSLHTGGSCGCSHSRAGH